MIDKTSLNTFDKVLLIFSSIYLIITSFISLWFIFILINEDIKLEFLVIITLIVGLFIIGLTLWTNSVLLSKIDSIGKREVTTNLVICLIQSFSFFLNGFCFKYTQGLEWGGFLHFHQLTNELDLKMLFPRLTFEFMFNFRSTNGILIGFNFITLLFSFFFIYIKKRYFKLPVIL